MCKYCEIENQEMIVDDGKTYFYIMNNLGIRPCIKYGPRYNSQDHGSVDISFCPFCGAQLVNDEYLQAEGSLNE